MVRLCGKFVAIVTCKRLSTYKKCHKIKCFPPVFCSFGGSEEPCAFGELISIGGFRGKNKEISAAIMTVIEKHLGVDPARFYINFVGVEGSNFGWQKTTF